MPKVNRLKSRRDFQAVFREGIRRHASHLTLRALRPSPSSKRSCDAAAESVKTQSAKQMTPPAQIGISISTKVSKRAVVRNRLKRQIAAAFYQLLPKISPGWRLVVIVKPTADIKCVTQQFLQELEQLLEQAEVFNGHS
nr:ribonuclease P protein component [Brasilonema sp. UFV-L1]